MSSFILPTGKPRNTDKSYNMKSTLKEINLFYVLIGVCSSFAWFFILWRTAYQWPAMDMFPFFERQADPTYLLNDFYTNAISTAPNPRYIFGYLIIGLSNAFNVDYYIPFYAIRVLLVLLLPALYYAVMYVYSKKYIQFENGSIHQLLILFFVFIVMYPRVSNFFSIAWWSPFSAEAQPQTLALLLGLIAILFKESAKLYVKLLSVLLFACATLIHPSIGLFVFGLMLILNFDVLTSNLKYYGGVLVIGILFPIVIITVFFGPQSPVDTKTFIDIYVIQNHPAHYHVADFGSFTSLSWKFSYTAMLLLLAIPAYFFYRKGNTKALILSGLFLITTIVVVICQYIFIDLVPIKFIASVGPVRFTMFTYWQIAILWVILLSELAIPLRLMKPVKVKPVIACLGIAILWVVGLIYIDSPKQAALEKDKDFYAFLNTTNQNSVFAAYFGNYTTDIPNVGRRAIFIGNGFPFNESSFIEHEQRRALLYGSKDQVANIEGTWLGEKYSKFFRSHSPAYFKQINETHRLDYVVIEAEYGSAFENYTPVFQNSNFKIFSVKDF